MRFKDQVNFIRRNMKKNRLRVFMTVLATTMACAFLIVLSSVGFGIQKTITDMTMSQQIVTKIAVYGKDDGKAVKKSDLEKFKHAKAVVERTQVYEPVKAKLNNRTNENMSLTLTNMNDELKSNMELDKGRVAKSENEIVVGYDFAKNLWTEKESKDFEKQINENNGNNADLKEPKGYTKDILNQTIELNVSKVDEKTGKTSEKTYDFKVVGITKKPKNDWMADSSVFVSDAFKGEFSKFLDLSKDSKSIEKSVSVYADKFDNVEQLTNDLTDAGYNVMSVTTQLQGVNTFFMVFKIGLIFVGCIAVIISAIGIFNTMTMAVTERTQEIGIMKAIGANPSIIRRMFLMESAYIGILGSVIGIIISYGVSYIVNLAVPVILESTGAGAAGELDYTFSYIPLSLVIIATVISAGVAVISGLNPARKATKTNVLTALRREL
ncbi:ABC transporter permease [Bacillus atrophaeus]|uniref:ABC transporter permease n=1 Tax=Bacillus atrophaeus TaxID=1452 RepID=UPI002E249C02|nr:FtsX-like permease family protein [Bacillus atrophaeus]MED1030152.1 FtsX-like permease family protein [Bacillus atrophaeus]MED1118636.1 FtsX-like permease family protein [Bacillus atrophaeus]MED1132758.1 FtsX-like permease family protein [Bacillus atrophaeus]